MNSWIFVVMLLALEGPLSVSTNVVADEDQCEAVRSRVKQSFTVLRETFKTPVFLFTQCTPASLAPTPEHEPTPLTPEVTPPAADEPQFADPKTRRGA